MFETTKNAFAATMIKETDSLTKKTVKATGYVAVAAAIGAAVYYGYKHFNSAVSTDASAADIPAAE